jgi:hypothetical protein
MNQPSDRANQAPGSVLTDVDATLRLVATLPPPAGLEDRVHLRVQANLRNTPHPARILHWPSAAGSTGAWMRSRMRSAAMRSAAAAAIVFVVAGGGWGIYTRVQPNKVIAMPSRGSAPGGFSGANAVRPAPPFNPPKAIPPAVTPQSKAPAQPKAGGRVVPMPRKTQPAAGAKAGPGAKTTVQAAAPAAR